MVFFISQDWGPMVAICDYVMEVHRQLLRTRGERPTGAEISLRLSLCKGNYLLLDYTLRHFETVLRDFLRLLRLSCFHWECEMGRLHRIPHPRGNFHVAFPRLYKIDDDI